MAANARQHNAGPLRESLRGRRTAHPALQRLAFVVGERQRGLRSSSRIGVLLVYTENTSRHLAAPFSFTISNSGH